MNGMVARQDHAAPMQRGSIWTYGELAVVLADIRKLQDIRPGDGVMIVGENRAPILALVEGNARSVVVNPRLSALEVDRLREKGDPGSVLFDEFPETARRHADVFLVREPRMRDVGPQDRQAVPLQIAVDLPLAAEAA
jgi:hypothetical protein